MRKRVFKCFLSVGLFNVPTHALLEIGVWQGIMNDFPKLLSLLSMS